MKTENLTCTPTVYFDSANQQAQSAGISTATTSATNAGPENGERFFCLVCGKNYLRKRHLQRHMRDECIGIPPRFECEFCPSKFRRKYHLVRHLNSRHSESITGENSGIIVNNRPKSDQKNHPSKQKMDANNSDDAHDSDSAVASTSSANDQPMVANENLVMNAAAIAAAAEFAANFTKDFSVDAIMMKREPCDQMMMPDLKLLEELQKKMNFAVNSDLFSTLRQMNPIKF